MSPELGQIRWWRRRSSEP